MLWKEPVCLFIVVLGIILFLYGANAYDALTGWTGVGLFVAGVLLYVALEAYGSLAKKKH